MKRLLVAVTAVCLLVAAAAFSGVDVPLGELVIAPEDRNPWTHLDLNNGPDEFQFAIVTDRTGGHRAGIFEKAVERLNLLQPEFVLSVGDLIEGGTEDETQLRLEWNEFRGFVSRLEMPFFYVPGNHDISNEVMGRKWKDLFGRSYYHFVYRDVLFLLLNSEDPPGKGPGNLSAEQLAYFRDVLDENRQVRWTVVSLHKPLWTYDEVSQTGWLEMEEALAGRPYTVFAGHRHRYERFLRNGQLYYMLATTGGGSKLRGPEVGEFDHVVWVTMKEDGPVLANLMVGGIFPEDVKSEAEKAAAEKAEAERAAAAKAAEEAAKKAAAEKPAQ